MRRATIEAPPVQIEEEEEDLDWRSKYYVELPKTLEGIIGVDYTKFEKFKSNYRGRYNEVDSEYLADYAEFTDFIGKQNYNVTVGDRVTGTVAMIDGPAKAWIEIGGKNHALLTMKEASIAPPEIGETIGDVVNLGQEYELEIISDVDNGREGLVTVSLKRIAYEKAWDKLTELYLKDPVVDGTVVAVNRGGAIVLVEGLRAFCPGSHLMASGGIATETMVGKKLQVKFLEVNKELSKLVVSNKRATLEHAMDAVERGNVVKGVITAVKNYGAFVEVVSPADADGDALTGGTLSGLLHISQISYDRVTDIEQTLHEGMEVKCMILDYDKTNGRIALSTKTLEPEPGDMLRDPQRVFELAYDTAAKYHARIEAEKIAREKAAQDMVLGLGDDLLSADLLSDDDDLLSDDESDSLGSDLDDGLPDLASLDDLATV